MKGRGKERYEKKRRKYQERKRVKKRIRGGRYYGRIRCEDGKWKERRKKRGQER